MFSLWLFLPHHSEEVKNLFPEMSGSLKSLVLVDTFEYSCSDKFISVPCNNVSISSGLVFLSRNQVYELVTRCKSRI